MMGQEDGKEEFVRIVPMIGSTPVLSFLRNTIASDYLKDVVSKTFFKSGTSTDGKELPLEIDTQELGSN